MKRIAFITDVHLAEQFPVDNNVNSLKNLETVLADISNRNITDIVFGGDIGEATAHDYFFDALKPFSVNLILGNHDSFDEVKQHFTRNADTKELYYKVEEAGYSYLFLDSSADAISYTQLQWLQAALADGRETVLFIHHPVLPINTTVDKLHPLKNREQLTAVLSDHKKAVTVFCGHYHMNDEQVQGNIRQLTTQALSFQLVKNSTGIEVDNSCFGYRVIEIHKDKIETGVINFINSSN